MYFSNYLSKLDVIKLNALRRIKYKKGRNVNSSLFEYTGIHVDIPVSMQLFVYNDSSYEEINDLSIDQVKKELKQLENTSDVKWLNIHGLHDVSLIQNLGEILDLPSYIIGDILNVTRRPKMEEMDHVLFFSIKSVLQDEQDGSGRIEQLSFILKDNLLVSFQEKKSDFFGHIRERIKQYSGPVRKKGSDYLLYLLLDSVMENFYISIENNEMVIEKLLIESKTSYQSNMLQNIERERDNINVIKRAIVPLREALFNIKSIKNDQDFSGIKNSNYTFFARLHQKSIELLEQIDYDIATLESASNIFFSSQNQRMNQIMKTLTIASVIFMPLTFIVGVYGMNFDNMPELHYQNGYFIVLGVMFLIAVTMAIYFKLKKWF